MNRKFAAAIHGSPGVPRTRGDEPNSGKSRIINLLVFPAPAGMNRICLCQLQLTVRVPRTRGDEPLDINSPSRVFACSPHPRG